MPGLEDEVLILLRRLFVSVQSMGLVGGLHHHFVLRDDLAQGLAGGGSACKLSL